MQGGAGGQAGSWQGGMAERNWAGPSLPSLWLGPLKPYRRPSKIFRGWGGFCLRICWDIGAALDTGFDASQMPETTLLPHPLPFRISGG